MLPRDPAESGLMRGPDMGTSPASSHLAMWEFIVPVHGDELENCLVNRSEWVLTLTV